MDDQLKLEFSIVNTAMAVRSMRDSGYKSTTHALAELVDNAIEAEATNIEIFGVSHRDENARRNQLKELAVLDNGVGMDPDLLRRSLRYGDSTRTSREGIGRFGLGLPNSSMSQARRVDVWSWQTGVTNAMHTYLAIADVEDGAIEIPEPSRRSIPKWYLETTRNKFYDSGTLVVWTELDRVEWKRATTTFKHTEFLLGRIYRRFLATENERFLHTDTGSFCWTQLQQRINGVGQKRIITCVPVDIEGERIVVDTENIVQVRPNDPLYLMPGTSCPEGFGSGPMFRELDSSPFVVPVSFGGCSHDVIVRASFVRRPARDMDDQEAEWPSQYHRLDAGRTPWGKHAGDNIGVSLIRANREIEINKSWIAGYDPTDRWWKIEIDFPTSLDEIFGVTNNKQSITKFKKLGQWREPEESPLDARKRMEHTGDHRRHLLDLHHQIDKTLRLLRQRVKGTKQQRRTRHRNAQDKYADKRASAVIDHRSKRGHEGQTDRLASKGSADEQRNSQIESLVNRHNLSPEDAFRKIEETLRLEGRVRWLLSEKDSPAFFDVESLPNVIQVAINTNHPVHREFYDVLHPDVTDMNEVEIRERLAKVSAAFRILIYAWARYEDELPEGERRRIRNARHEWGKYAEEFFEPEEDDEGMPSQK